MIHTNEVHTMTDDVSIESLKNEFNQTNIPKSVYKESAQIQMKLIKHNIKKLNNLD